MRTDLQSSADIESLYIGSQLVRHESGPDSILQAFDQRLDDLDITSVTSIADAQLGLIILSEQQRESVLGLSSDLFEQQSRLNKTVEYQIWRGDELLVENDSVSTFRDLSVDQSNAAAKNREVDLIFQEINTDLIDQLLRRLRLFISANDES